MDYEPLFIIPFAISFVTCPALPPRSTYRKLLLLLLSVVAAQGLYAQYKVRGTVYDKTRTYPLEAVSVMSTGGRFTTTNSEGAYTIEVAEQDSIWFSYLDKPTVKFPVKKMMDVNQFDLALEVPVTVLPEIKIKPRDYRLDSIQNRRDYAKVFDFRKPNLESMTSIGPNGAGIDINELIRTFQFRKNRSTMRFQERLLQQERDKFVEHRFNALLVRRLTGLEGEELKRFMSIYRPSYEFALYTSDYDFHLYIKEAGERFKKGVVTRPADQTFPPNP